MFSRVSNASKFAFIQYVDELKKEGVELVDCQVYSDHLASLGARMISRSSFMEFL
jgi:leucyl/phenylalanyl-tRNA--protein transferase